MVSRFNYHPSWRLFDSAKTWKCFYQQNISKNSAKVSTIHDKMSFWHFLNRWTWLVFISSTFKYWVKFKINGQIDRTICENVNWFFILPDDNNTLGNLKLGLDLLLKNWNFRVFAKHALSKTAIIKIDL